LSLALSDEDVSEILRIIDSSQLDELEIETPSFSLYVSRKPGPGPGPGPGPPVPHGHHFPVATLAPLVAPRTKRFGWASHDVSDGEARQR
jgi:hypothetical protein